MPRTLVHAFALLLLVVALVGVAACDTTDVDESVTEVSFVAMPAVAAGDVPAERMERVASVLETRARVLLGADVDVRWERRGSDRLRLTTSSSIEDPERFAADIATPGRPRIRPVAPIGPSAWTTLHEAVVAGTRIDWSPPENILYAPGVTRRFLFGPPPERDALIRLVGSQGAMDDAIDRLYPDGPPPGSTERALPQGLNVWRTYSPIGTQGVRATSWFHAGPVSDGLLVGPRRVAFSDPDATTGWRRLTYELVPRDREILQREFVRPGGVSATVLGAGLVINTTIIAAAASDPDRSAELVFEDIAEGDGLLLEAMLESGPLGVQVLPVPPAP